MVDQYNKDDFKEEPKLRMENNDETTLYMQNNFGGEGQKSSKLIYQNCGALVFIKIDRDFKPIYAKDFGFD